MADKNNQQQNAPKMPKFNMGWIYAVVLLGLMAFYFTKGSTNSSIETESSYHNFKNLVMKGYAEKIVVNKEQNILHMYVKPEHIRDVFKRDIEQTGKEPTVKVQFGSVDQVEEFIDSARVQQKFTGDYSYDNKKEDDFLSMLLWNLLPIVVLVGLWVFIMRRMSGGSGIHIVQTCKNFLKYLLFTLVRLNGRA